MRLAQVFAEHSAGSPGHLISAAAAPLIAEFFAGVLAAGASGRGLVPCLPRGLVRGGRFHGGCGTAGCSARGHGLLSNVQRHIVPPCDHAA